MVPLEIEMIEFSLRLLSTRIPCYINDLITKSNEYILYKHHITLSHQSSQNI